MSVLPYASHAHIETYYRQRNARPIVGSGVNHDARQGERLRSGVTIEAHVASSGKLREISRETVGRTEGGYLAQSERLRAKVKQLDHELTRYALSLRDETNGLTRDQVTRKLSARAMCFARLMDIQLVHLNRAK